MYKKREISTDVLVIGGGTAGGLAALEASKETENVIIAIKGLGGKSGNTPMAEGGIQATFHGEDSIENHVMDTLLAGKNINNESLVRIMAEKAPDLFRYIEEYGVSFKKEEDGSFFQFTTSGSSYPRCLWLRGGGAGLARKVFHSVLEANIGILEDTMITKLLVSDGYIAGAVGLDYRNGNILVIRAKAVVLATGGNERLYYFSDGSVDSTGDGVALALDANAELIDMEFIQFYPHALVYPDALRGTIITEEIYYEGMFKAEILNGKGEEFAHKYDPINREKTTRDVLSRGIFTEIQEGRGTEHGGVIIDATNCDKNEILGIIGPLYNYLKRNGLDLLQTPLEVAPSAHYQCGGIRIDSDGSTNIKGLYAAGECMGGLDGANRLSSNALTGAIVFGIIAGINAGLYANEAKVKPLAQDEVNKAINDIISIVNGDMEDGFDVLEIKKYLQKLMTQKVGVVRNKDGLEMALSELLEIRNYKYGSIVLSNRELACNQELIEALELKSLIENAILVVKSALFRRESRGSHYREDYPHESEIWKKHTLISKEGENIKIEAVGIGY